MDRNKDMPRDWPAHGPDTVPAPAEACSEYLADPPQQRRAPQRSGRQPLGKAKIVVLVLLAILVIVIA